MHKAILRITAALFFFMGNDLLPMVSTAISCRPKDEHTNDLVQALGSPSFQKRQAAERELERIGADARDALARLVDSGRDPEARFRARRLLHRIDRNGKIQPPEFDRSRVGAHFEECGGRIAGEVRWRAGTCYHVTSSLTVTAAARLEIEAGVVVLLDPDVELHVEPEGLLIVNGGGGSPSATVAFAAANADDAGKSPWGRFVIRGNAVLRHVEIRNTSGVVVASQHVRMSDVSIYDSASDGITFLDTGERPVERLTIRNPSGNGCVVAKGGPRLDGLFVAGGECGVCVRSGASLRATGLTIGYASQCGLRSGGGITNVHGLTVYDCAVGLSFFHEDGENAYGEFVDTTIEKSEEYGIFAAAGSHPSFDLLRISKVKGDAAIQITGASPSFKDAFVEDVDGDAIRVLAHASPQFEHVNVQRTRGNALQVDGESYPTIHHASFHSIGRNAIVVGGLSHPEVSDIIMNDVLGDRWRIGIGSNLRDKPRVSNIERRLQETKAHMEAHETRLERLRERLRQSHN